MDIEIELRRWAAWARESNGLGYKPLAMFDDGTRSKVVYYPMTDDEGLRFEPAIVTLKQIDKELYDIVRLHYLQGLSLRAVAIAMGTNRQSVFNYLQSAKTFVAGFVCGTRHEARKSALLSLTK